MQREVVVMRVGRRRGVAAMRGGRRRGVVVMRGGRRRGSGGDAWGSPCKYWGGYRSLMMPMAREPRPQLTCDRSAQRDIRVRLWTLVRIVKLVFAA